jgi:hypothetical protein
MNTQMKFSTNQQQFIHQGKIAREALRDAVSDACQSDVHSARPHHYFHSIAGYGKTFTIKQGLENSNTPYRIISGNVSMFAFGISLAVIHYQMKRSKVDRPMIIVVDDCDTILSGHNNLNIIKNILEGERTYKYEKSMAASMASLNSLQVAAIKFCVSDQNMGFTVDCNNMIFIFASNKKLPTKAEVEKRPNAETQHAHAIRSRCHYQSFDYNWERMWGWIADVTLNTNVVEFLNADQKMILLDWVFNNWKYMSETSIRTVEKMAEIMVKKPDTYKDMWELSYLTNL